jgi:MFS family permease
MPYLIIYMEHYLGIADYALLLGVVLILASAASVIMGRFIDKYGKQRFLYPAGAAFSAGLLILYASGKTLQGNSSATMLTLAIFGTIMMAGSLVLMATLSAGMRDLIPEEKRGHYSGIRMIFFVLLPMVIGPFIGSAVIKGGKTILDEFGFVQDVPNPEMFLAAAAVSLLAFIPYALVMREWKRGAAGAE